MRVHRRICQIIGIPAIASLILLLGWGALPYLLGFMFLLSSIFGRAFCSWLCPIGTFEELVGLKTYKPQGLPPRPGCRLGCPPVWLMGWLNKVSLFKIELDADRCVRCGICGQVCLTRSPKQGAGWDEGINPADSYSCIRCGSCIDACPERALSLSLRWRYKRG